MATLTAPAPAPAPVKPVAPARITTPFDMMRSLSQDMDRMLGDFGLHRRWPFMPFALEDAAWAPPLEVSENDGALRVRVDLPGLEKKDVKVDLTNDALVVQGERRHEEEKKGQGYFRSERSYGRFFRSVPLPEGARPETAKATFANGVLEIVIETGTPPMPATRRVEIGEPAKPV
jgi:HSP20 family protein